MVNVAGALFQGVSPAIEWGGHYDEGTLWKKHWQSPRTEMPLSLVMGEFKSLLQSWGRHVLEDLKRREILQGSIDSTQTQRKVSRNSLCFA